MTNDKTSSRTVSDIANSIRTQFKGAPKNASTSVEKVTGEIASAKAVAVVTSSDSFAQAVGTTPSVIETNVSAREVVFFPRAMDFILGKSMVPRKLNLAPSTLVFSPENLTTTQTVMTEDIRPELGRMDSILGWAVVVDTYNTERGLTTVNLGSTLAILDESKTPAKPVPVPGEPLGISGTWALGSGQTSGVIVVLAANPAVSMTVRNNTAAGFSTIATTTSSRPDDFVFPTSLQGTTVPYFVEDETVDAPVVGRALTVSGENAICRVYPIMNSQSVTDIISNALATGTLNQLANTLALSYNQVNG